MLEYGHKDGEFIYVYEYIAFLNFISWVKMITLLKFFTGTRIFIHLLEQVVIDIASFLQIFFFSCVMFATTFFLLGMEAVADKLEEKMKEEENKKIERGNMLWFFFYEFMYMGRDVY